MTQWQKSWQGQHFACKVAEASQKFLWFGCVFVVVVMFLCFCDGAVVMLWWSGCVFVMWLCFCGGVVAFLW